MQCVGVVSRYTHDPKTSHSVVLKQILRYLKGTMAYGLYYRRDGGDKGLVGYSDIMNQCPVSWCSQKQDIVALSSCEAEFMAATEAAKQEIWLQDLLSEIMEAEVEKAVICIDNKSAIALTKNHVFHGRSKHIHRRFHFIRECIENELITVEHVAGKEKKADILTKALGRIKFKEMRDLIGVKDVKDCVYRLKGEIIDLSL